MNSIYNADTGEVLELTEPFSEEEWIDCLHDDPRVGFDAIEGRFEANSETIKYWLDWRDTHRQSEAFILSALEQLDEDSGELLRIKLADIVSGIESQPLRHIVATIEFMATQCLFWKDGRWRSGGSGG